MSTSSTLLILLYAFLPTFAAPTGALEPRGASQCAPFSSIATGPYTIYANEWGGSTGTGSQCSQINSLSGDTLAWSTAWSWANSPYSVKSYTNVEVPMTSKPLNQYTSIPTTWNWRQANKDCALPWGDSADNLTATPALTSSLTLRMTPSLVPLPRPLKRTK